MSGLTKFLQTTSPSTVGFPRSTLPVLRLPGQVLLPHATIPFSRRKLIELFCADNSKEIPACILVLEGEGLQPAYSERSRTMGCVANVVQWTDSPQERGLVLLRGVTRARFRHLPGTSSISQLAQVTFEPDQSAASMATNFIELRQRLIACLFRHLPELAIGGLSSLLECELSLGQLCDLTATTMGLSLSQQLEILDEPQVDRRCTALLQMSAKTFALPQPFLPDFGIN